MKTLNLTDPERSEIKYKISKFPDGQQNIVINNEPDEFNNILPGYYYLAGKSKIYTKDSVEIKSRLNNWSDLELIVCTIASLRELGIEKIHLYCPMFLGARSDRKFEDGGNWYLKQVICPIINSLELASIAVTDAHSFVLGNLLNNYKAVDNEHLVSHFAIPEIIKNMKLPARAVDEYHITPKDLHYDKRGFDNLILVSPDVGASHKIQKIAEAIGYTDRIIVCTKERDANGKLTRTNVPFIDAPDKDFIIIDDICDGGRTFTNIASEIRNNIIDRYKGKGKIYLIVTHGIFSAGFEELSKYFDGIYCTNSYADNEKVYQKARWANCNKPPFYIGNNLINKEHFITQLNIF